MQRIPGHNAREKKGGLQAEDSFIYTPWHTPAMKNLMETSKNPDGYLKKIMKKEEGNSGHSKEGLGD